MKEQKKTTTVFVAVAARETASYLPFHGPFKRKVTLKDFSLSLGGYREKGANSERIKLVSRGNQKLTCFHGQSALISTKKQFYDLYSTNERVLADRKQWLDGQNSMICRE
jgi:hypothetical protein